MGETGSKTVKEGEKMGETGSETVKEGEKGVKEIVEEGEEKTAEEGEEVWLDIVLSSSEDSEDDPIVKEEVGVAPRLLLNPYFVE